jgi:hypothetical protein
MSEIDDGGPAFSQSCTSDGYPSRDCSGLTVRDYFAIHAPIGFRLAEDFRTKRTGGESFTYEKVFTTLAAMRYSFADAMIAARAAPESEES